MPPRRVVVVHNAVLDCDDPSTRDVLAQVAWVVGGLVALGIEHDVLPLGEDGLEPARLAGEDLAVFNLVESPPGRPRFQIEAAEAIRRCRVPSTGSRPEAIWLTTDKVATRQCLDAAGLAVAPGGVLDPERPGILDEVPPPWILKPALEDASLGLDDEAVTSDPVAAVARARHLMARFGQPILAEHLLPGREFNLALLAGRHDVEVLPAAEMLYLDFPPGRPRILGWSAKWDDESFVARHTVRRFVQPGDDESLVSDLVAAARGAWAATGVEGYARVDLRLDEDGRPRILEVNANPCLAADAGFVAAAAGAGLDAAAVVGRILAAAREWT